MPFARPTLTDLISQSQADFGTSSLLPVSNTMVLALQNAYAQNGMFGYLDYIAKQSNPYTATDEWLEAWAALKQVYRKAPTAATGTATFTGSLDSTLSADIGCALQDGTAFVTTSSAEVGSDNLVTVNVTATDSDALAISAGAPIALSVAQPGVTSTGTYTPVTAGSNLETDAQLRTRMLARYAAPAQGGSVSDFTGWTLDVAGVTRAWIAPGMMGPGTIVVFFMMDDSEAAFGGFPQGVAGVATTENRGPAATGDPLTVANALAPLQPASPVVWASAPLENLITMTITGLSAASSAVKAAITAAVQQTFLTQGSPGGVVVAAGQTAGLIPLSYVEGAIGSVAGSAGYVISAMTASAGSASPTANITSNAGYLPTLATPITFL